MLGRSLYERNNFAICNQAVRVKQFKCHLFDQVLSSLKVNGSGIKCDKVSINLNDPARGDCHLKMYVFS